MKKILIVVTLGLIIFAGYCEISKKQYKFVKYYETQVTVGGARGIKYKTYGVGDIIKGRRIASGIKVKIAPLSIFSIIPSNISHQSFIIVPVSYLKVIKNNVVTQNEYTKFSSSYFKFSYKNVAKALPSKYNKHMINVGVGDNDTNFETVGFLSDTNIVSYFDHDNMVVYENEKYGSNIFEVYQDKQDGSKLYVLTQGEKAITVSVPLQHSNNPTIYIDLSTLSFQ